MQSVDTEFSLEIYRKSGEGTVIPPRFHMLEFELCEILSGDAVVRIGTRRTEAREGTVFFVPKGTPFSVSAQSGSVSVRGVIFDSYLVESDMVSFDAEVLDLFSVFAENRSAEILPDAPEQKEIHRALDALYDEYLCKEVCYRLPLRAWLLLLMADLLRAFCKIKNEQDQTAYHNVVRLRPVLREISDRLCDKIYIEELAGKIGVSPDYFTKMFRDSIGKTPVDYMNALRVKNAVRLLISTEEPIPAIAEQTGFSGASYFQKTFKQHMGISPAAYRKILRGISAGEEESGF